MVVYILECLSSLGLKKKGVQKEIEQLVASLDLDAGGGEMMNNGVETKTNVHQLCAIDWLDGQCL